MVGSNSEKELVVVKFGSELIVNGGTSQSTIERYAENLTQRFPNKQLVIVSSGAIALGRTVMGPEVAATSCASYGNTMLMSYWQNAFSRNGLRAGQVLITHNDLEEDKDRRNTLLSTLKQAFADGMVPIVNENDMLSNQEIMAMRVGGDNDGLASHLAVRLGAKQLWLMTKKGGIVNDQRALIPSIQTDSASEIQEMLRKRPIKSDSVGRGGIVSKFNAALRFALVDPSNTAYISMPTDLTSGVVTTIISQRYGAA